MTCLSYIDNVMAVDALARQGGRTSAAIVLTWSLIHCCILVQVKSNPSGNMPWASCQIRKIAGAHAPGMPGTFSPSPRVRDPDMHHGTCVTHVPWCMPGSLTSGFLWNWRREENVPGISGACATCNFTYLVRGPWPEPMLTQITNTILHQCWPWPRIYFHVTRGQWPNTCTGQVKSISGKFLFFNLLNIFFLVFISDPDIGTFSFELVLFHLAEDLKVCCEVQLQATLLNVIVPRKGGEN